jgi:hypothetical protein
MYRIESLPILQLTPLQLIEYDFFFDSRWKDGGVASRASQSPEQFCRFVPPAELHLPDPDALAAMREVGATADSHLTDVYCYAFYHFSIHEFCVDLQASAKGEASLEASGTTVEGEGAAHGSEKQSGFDMGKALKGAERKAEAEEGGTAAEGRGLNEPGVVRTGGALIP